PLPYHSWLPLRLSFWFPRLHQQLARLLSQRPRPLRVAPFSRLMTSGSDRNSTPRHPDGFVYILCQLLPPVPLSRSLGFPSSIHFLANASPACSASPWVVKPRLTSNRLNSLRLPSVQFMRT